MSYKEYFVYILSNKHHTVFYTGVTNDLETRVLQHKKKENNRSFTSRYNISKLLWYESHNDISIAIQREKIIKKWKREWKENVISDMNPLWKDLSEDWFD